MLSDFQVMRGPLINPTFGSFWLLPFLVMYVNLGGKISASSAFVLIFQNDSRVARFVYLYFSHTESGILIIPPLLSLHPQGLNNFKKYFKSCNKITSKEMGRGMEGSGIKGEEKREPLPLPPNLDSA